MPQESTLIDMTRPARSDETRTHDLVLTFDELALIYKSLQAVKTLAHCRRTTSSLTTRWSLSIRRWLQFDGAAGDGLGSSNRTVSSSARRHRGTRSAFAYRANPEGGAGVREAARSLIVRREQPQVAISQ
jgi:hypothetical protein